MTSPSGRGWNLLPFVKRKDLLEGEAGTFCNGLWVNPFLKKVIRGKQCMLPLAFRNALPVADALLVFNILFVLHILVIDFFLLRSERRNLCRIQQGLGLRVVNPFGLLLELRGVPEPVKEPVPCGEALLLGFVEASNLRQDNENCGIWTLPGPFFNERVMRNDVVGIPLLGMLMLIVLSKEGNLEDWMQCRIAPAGEELRMILACSIEDAATEKSAIHLLLYLNSEDVAGGVLADKVEHGLLAADGVWPLLPVTVLENVAHLDVPI